MSFARIIVPAAPVRRKPGHRREMSNQLLFGEAVEILKEKGNLWVKVRSVHDGYEGWLTRTLLETVTEDEARESAHYLAPNILSTINISGLEMKIPLGSELPGFANGSGRIGRQSFSIVESVLKSAKEATVDDIELWAKTWLNAPYLWGGRTILGVDCSGFVQVNYKLCGKQIPRDAWQQAQEGTHIPKLKQALKGDLAFFDDKDEIVHVGILLDAQTIIHSSGKVRIDEIDKKGIINVDSGKRTHSLRAIRRFF